MTLPGRPARGGGAWALLVLLAMMAGEGDEGWSESLAAQEGRVPSDLEPAPVPFGPGETLEYQAKLGPVPVGDGHLRVHGLEDVRGRTAYHVSLHVEGGVPLARVNDQQESWLDVETLTSRRFSQNLRQVRYRRDRSYEIFPEERYFTISDQEGQEEMITDAPLDDISFVYYARSLPLEVGDVYRLDRYFQPDGNPVLLEVVRRDRVEVPAGTFNTVVVRPTIQASGLFGEGGEAEIHFSDDDRRLLVELRSRVPVVGSLSLHLREVTPGDPLGSWSPASLEEAAERYREAARNPR